MNTARFFTAPPPAAHRRPPARPGLALLLALALALALAGPLPSQAAGAAGQAIPPPPGLFAGDTPPAEPALVLTAFLGLPYREDGAVNEGGEYTQFAARDRRFTTPGLNCSGFVLAASRYLVGRNISLDEAVRDRMNDSGPGAAHGQDWDFGWDLILNISEGLPRRLLLPGGKSLDPKDADASLRGYPIQAASTWRDLPPRLRPGRLYLVSLSMIGRSKGYGLQHYHVGLIHVSPAGEAWFYQTTGRGGGVNRRNLNSPSGRASFKRAFADSGGQKKMMLVLEADLPAGR